MVKLANTYGSGPYVARLAGSSPVTRTKKSQAVRLEIFSIFIKISNVFIRFIFISNTAKLYKHLQPTKYNHDLIQGVFAIVQFYGII